MRRITRLFYYTLSRLATKIFVLSKNPTLQAENLCYNLFVIVQSKYGRVAQLGERTVRIRKVEGSIPFMSTSFSGKSLGRLP